MIGQTISHYRIVEKLGGGGIGVVYKAVKLAMVYSGFPGSDQHRWMRCSARLSPGITPVFAWDDRATPENLTPRAFPRIH